jgi:hypothetical protein
VESNSTNQLPSNNSAAQAAITKNPPEDPLEKETFDLIKRYWTDPEAASHPRVDNSDLLDGIDYVSEKNRLVHQPCASYFRTKRRSIRH